MEMRVDKSKVTETYEVTLGTLAFGITLSLATYLYRSLVLVVVVDILERKRR